MKIQIRGKDLDVTPALHDYVEKKIGRLEKFFSTPSIHDVHVTLSVVRDQHSVEVTMPLNNLILRAEEKSEDMYASIDVVSEKLERQLEKTKSKLAKRVKQDGIHSLFKEPGPERSQATAVVDEEADGEVVRVKRFAIKPMPIDEAIMQMDLLGHDFFVFSNAETDEVNVVYKRHDGQYGLIEPSFA